MRYITAALTVLAVACATAPEPAPPAEEARADGAGRLTATYEVRTKERPVAQVNVWSRGADAAGEGPTIVRLSLLVLNARDGAVQLGSDQLELVAFGREGHPLHRCRPAIVSTRVGAPVVAAGARSEFQVSFALPGAIEPEDIELLRLRWALVFSDGARYRQFTELARVPEPLHATGGAARFTPVAGVYDPFLHGPPYSYADHEDHRVLMQRMIVQPRPPEEREPDAVSSRAAP